MKVRIYGTAMLLFCFGCGAEVPGNHRSQSYAVSNKSDADPNQGLDFVDGLEFDHGEAWEFSRLDTKFRIRNVSRDQIVFRNAVSTTCGCTKGTIEPAVLGPGETAVLSLNVDVTPEAGYRKAYTATLHRDLPNGKRADIPFRIYATCKAVWRVSPSHLSVRVGEEDRSLTLGVMGVHGRDLALKNITCSIPESTVTFRQGRLDPATSEPVKVTVPRGTPAGHYSLLLETDDANVSTRRVRIEVYEDTPIRVVPVVVTLRREQDEWVGNLSVFHPTGTIASIEPHSNMVTTSEEPKFFEDGKVFTRFTIRRSRPESTDDKPQTERGRVMISSDDGTTRHVEFKFVHSRSD